MNLGELLESVRGHYLKHYRDTLRERRHAPSTRVIAEPALRQDDGDAAREGALKLPVRIDMVVCTEFKEDESLEVTTDKAHEFEPFALAWNDALEVSLHPFRWEACTALLHGAPALDEWWPIIEWFEKWFDEFDTKGSLKRDIQEVVHHMSDPVLKDGMAAFKVDFGTAPPAAFEEFLNACQNIGVQAVEIGD